MNKKEKSFEDIIRYLIKEEMSVLLVYIKDLFSKKTGCTDKVMNLEEFCVYVGCSRSHAYKLTSKSLVPFSRKNGRVWFQQSKVDMWLMDNPSKSRTEIEANVDSYLSSKRPK